MKNVFWPCSCLLLLARGRFWNLFLAWGQWLTISVDLCWLCFQVEFLCERGADVNRGLRSSSLHYAACFGRPQIVKTLLRYGANPDLRDEDSKTPLDKARERGDEGHREVIQILQSPGMLKCIMYKDWLINPFTLRTAKTGLTILIIFFLQKHFLKNIWRRNVYQKFNKNSPSNILWIFALFLRFIQKYESSRCYFLEELWVWMG